MKLHFLIIPLLLFNNMILAKDNKMDVNYVIIEEASQPFQIHHKNGSESGIFTDVVYSIFDNEHYNLNNHIVPALRYKNIIEQFQNKSAHALKKFISYGSVDWFPKEMPIIYSKMPIVTMKSSLIVSNNRNFKFSKISDLFDKTIILGAVQQNFKQQFSYQY